MDDIQRFDVPTKQTVIEGFRAFRAYLEKALAAQGENLHLAWYDDGPENAPFLYEDQPELLESLKKITNKKGDDHDQRPA